MTVTVYYSTISNVMIHDLEPLSSHLADIFKGNPDFVLNCPAFKNTYKNTFIIKYPHDYQLEWDGVDFKTNMYDQKFFNENIKVRSTEVGFVSLSQPAMLFFTDVDDLEIEQMAASFHKNNFTNNCHLVTGSFNIGKHIPRRLETAFVFKNKTSIDLNSGDALYYIRFKTNEKIVVKQFIMTNSIMDITGRFLNIRNSITQVNSLQWWYELVSRNKLKKYFLKEIKKTLL